MFEGGGGFVYTGVSYEAQRGIVRRLDNFMMLRVVCYIWVGDLFGGMLRRICLVGGARICKGWR